MADSRLFYDLMVLSKARCHSSFGHESWHVSCQELKLRAHLLSSYDDITSIFSRIATYLCRIFTRFKTTVLYLQDLWGCCFNDTMLPEWDNVLWSICFLRRNESLKCCIFYGRRRYFSHLHKDHSTTNLLILKQNSFNVSLFFHTQQAR